MNSRVVAKELQSNNNYSCGNRKAMLNSDFFFREENLILRGGGGGGIEFWDVEFTPLDHY